MKSSILSSICIAVILSLCLSSCNSTEKYAKKESGKEFSIWQLTFNADENYVYWPRLSLTEDTIGGSLRTIITEKHVPLFSNRVTTTIDTSFSNSSIQIVIENKKSTTDANRFFIIYLKTLDPEGYYWRNSTQTVVFNSGQKDSVIVSSKTNDKGFLGVGRDNSEKILALLCSKKLVNIQVSYSTYSNDYIAGDTRYYDSVASFTIEGSPKLANGLNILQTRMELAEKESRKFNLKHD